MEEKRILIISFALIALLIITAMFVDGKDYARYKNLESLIKENHKITLTQIEKQITTQTKYIKLLEEVLRGEG